MLHHRIGAGIAALAVVVSAAAVAPGLANALMAAHRNSPVLLFRNSPLRLPVSFATAPTTLGGAGGVVQQASSNHVVSSQSASRGVLSRSVQPA